MEQLTFESEVDTRGDLDKLHNVRRTEAERHHYWLCPPRSSAVLALGSLLSCTGEMVATDGLSHERVPELIERCCSCWLGGRAATVIPTHPRGRSRHLDKAQHFCLLYACKEALPHPSCTPGRQLVD